MFNKIYNFVYIIILCFCITTLSIIGVLQSVLPQNFNVLFGEELEINTAIPINATKTNVKSDGNYNVMLKMLGLIPISNASVNTIYNDKVEILGTPFGIKIYTNGVMVVGITDVDGIQGAVSPGHNAGLKLGDLIININGVKVLSNEEVATIIEQSNGKVLRFNIVRNNKKINLNVKPVLSKSSNKYKTGIWVRDSSAGIGTATFYSPKLKISAGLGHGICDIDTNELLTINSGQTVRANILNVKKSEDGSPGELQGQFLEETIGDILTNNDTGIYYTNNNLKCKMLKEIALKQEVVPGDAKIYTCIDGTTPKYYNCIIEKVSYNDNITKNLVIRITDADLIDKTGGIVQGMSGSPIIQNNKLIGAVTHVFVNNPKKGYGIFAENMLTSAQETIKLKNAS